MNTLLQTALQLHRVGQFVEAETLYRQILLSQPNHAEALHFLGLLAHQSGQHESATNLILHAIHINSSNAGYYSNLGLTYQALDRPYEAIACFQKAISLNPDFTEGYINLGLTLHRQDKLNEAVINLQNALVIKPDYAQAYNNLGIIFYNLDKQSSAIACYQKALIIKSDNAMAYYNLGLVVLIRDKLDKATTYFQQALLIEPNYAEANVNLGSISLRQGKPDEATIYYQRAFVIKTNSAFAYSNWLLVLQYLTAYSPKEILAAHLRYTEQFEAPLQATWPVHRNVLDPHRRLKIGYVSPDFHLHSVAFFIEPVLAHHDASQVEVYAYYNHRQRDAVTARIQSYADHWIPCHTWSDDALARRILEDRIDILVDLAGHTAHSRLLTFARKPAPIQITYLGYVSTTGLTAIDYRFTILDADPLGNDAYNSEALYRLPHTLWCYRPPVDAPDVSLPTPAATHGYVTFGSMNYIAKVSPEALALWAQILLEVPHSRLLIAGVPEGSARLALHERFAAHGIGPERLILHGKMPHHRFRALHHQIDIALDPFPHHGNTTTCETLWMGVPVISLCGQAFVSRFGFVLLKALKLQELVAQSPQDYVRIAKDLATDLPRLTALRASLRARFNASPLRNELAFTQHIELAYRSMWHTWCLTKSSQ